MICTICQNNVDERRAQLGLSTCLECGDNQARQLIKEKHMRVGVAWNKGTEMYLGSTEQTRQILKAEGARKHLPLDDSNSPRLKSSVSSSKQVPKTAIYEFVRWEFPVDKRTGVRTKRAILKRVE